MRHDEGGGQYRETTRRRRGVTARGPLRDRNFMLYFCGVVLSEVGLRGTLSINLYHIYALTGSTGAVGLVGAFQLAALFLLAPLGGAIADRLDRRRLVQVMQTFSLAVSASLALVTFTGAVRPWHVYAAVLLNTAAASFDNPARRALIPAIVPRSQLTQAFALVTPGREIAHLAGPALGGLLVTLGGPGLMYAVDSASYAFLIGAMMVVRVRPLERTALPGKMLASILEGVRFVRDRPIVWKLMAIDVVATAFGAYRVVLPALAEEVLGVGASGYGLLAAAPPAGALIGSWLIYRSINTWRGGRVTLWAVAVYGCACVALAQAPLFGLAVAAAMTLGGADAMGATVRTSTVHAETPDEIRGRVSSLYQMAVRGGPSIGSLNVGLLSTLMGPVAALTVGGAVPVLMSGWLAARSPAVREYAFPPANG